MRYATTFSGIGGWEIGLNACGWELAWQCEKEPFCRTLLHERFGVPICRDIRHLVRWLQGMQHRGIDIFVHALIGSPPCQPFSLAGTQRGTADARHLFPYFLGVVGFLHPEWILMEQVPAILSLHQGKAFEEYIGGLVALGYDLLWHCLPACAVGACHRRDRLWIIAHARSVQYQGTSRTQRRSTAPRFFEVDSYPTRGLRQRTTPRQGRYAPLLDQIVSDTDRKLQHRSGRTGTEGGTQSSDFRPLVSHTDRSRLQRRLSPGLRSSPRQITPWPDRPSPAFDEKAWTETVPTWWLAEPDMGRVAHGIPHRVDRLKGLGNAVVPQIPFLIGQAITSTLCLPV